MLGENMNNKGFAITTMIYALVILLTISMFVVLDIMDNDYKDNKQLVEDVQKELDTCLENGTC